MTDSPRHDAAGGPSGGADLTRDIRLPAMPDRPPSVLPREWSGMNSTPPVPDVPAPPSADDGAAGRGTSAVYLQTDELDPPFGRPRERTISFVTPEMARGRPMPTVGRTPRRPRRWPWVLLALIPVVVIAVSGVWWFLLLRAA